MQFTQSIGACSQYKRPPSPKAIKPRPRVKRPWLPHLEENKTNWKARTHRDAELRAQLSVVHDSSNGEEPPARVIV
ncbi:hypothetical protein CEXT_787851 [Caerostris extrusa]|uniref:Uncharacterized protein n=1 Tax=Caerostris extrusa TaxID=172846 RepID=A0AAV4P8S0_CAEEX|nr:hypothetical protein CEXT_787851 [Caerostris extrusa]